MIIGNAKDARFALVRLLVGAVLISFSPVFVRLTSVSPTTSGFYRVLFGGLILLGAPLILRRPVVNKRFVFLLLAVAAFFFAGDLWFWHRSIFYVGPGLATLLANFQVFILAIAGIVIFGEKLRWEVVVSIPMALIGLALIVDFDWRHLEPGYRTGILFGLATAVFYAGYLLSLRRARSEAGGVSASADMGWMSLICAVMLAAVAFGSNESLVIPGLRDAGILVAYAVVAQVAGWILIATSLPQLPASRVGLVLLLQPTLAFVWDVLFFDRPVTISEGLGLGIALAAIYIGARPSA